MATRAAVSKIFGDVLPAGTSLTSSQIVFILQRLGEALGKPWSDDQIKHLLLAAGAEDGNVTVDWLLSWMFKEEFASGDVVQKGGSETGTGAENDSGQRLAIETAIGKGDDEIVVASILGQLQKLVQEHPYVEEDKSYFPHPVVYWIKRCRASLDRKKFRSAHEDLQHARSTLQTDKQQIAEAFRRFDVDQSGSLDTEECRHMCAYLGWGLEEADLMDLNKDGKVTLEEFQTCVGRMGGIRQLFEQRRLRISTSRKDVCDYAGIAVGARVRAHYYAQGQKSRLWKEAQVLGVGVQKYYGAAASGVGPSTLGVKLLFGFGAEGKKRWFARQVVPPAWIVSGLQDASVVSALRESGILDEQQAFWTLLLPETELHAVQKLVSCQRQALATVRGIATKNHEEALPKVRQRFQNLGYEPSQLQDVFDWVQDLAPVVVHLHLDKVGKFMETDEYYRSQFETKTSEGALDQDNSTRKRWETELFGGAYDGCAPFDRCKYGALSVMNDYRGVLSARQYGDSYLVLKDVRLRCTFASEDSGGMRGSRLAVLDKYAHVLSEYSDRELHGIVQVAGAAKARTGSLEHELPKLVRGSSEDPTKNWITTGYPAAAQRSGCFYFEVVLMKGCAAPQVGLLSDRAELRPGAASPEGVGDDEFGWAVDGVNAISWNKGRACPWSHIWPSSVQSILSGRPNHEDYSEEEDDEDSQPHQDAQALSKDVVVGVCADLDNRLLFFSTDGVWDSGPTFHQEDIPEGSSLYPAVSLHGRAAFCFGPSFRHPPKSDAFKPWPGAPSGLHRIDNPQVGNSGILSIYKEMQLHGELHLGRHVQRLVAASKYRNIPKVKRKWDVDVKNAGPCDAVYQRTGVHDGMPFYRQKDTGWQVGQKVLGKRGGDWLPASVEEIRADGTFLLAWEDGSAEERIKPYSELKPAQGESSQGGGVLYYDSATARWRINKESDFTEFMYCAPVDPGNPLEPPRQGWMVPDLARGSLPTNAFIAGMTKQGLSTEAARGLAEQLASPGSGEVVQRVVGEQTFDAEWAKLSSSPSSADDAWTATIADAQASLLDEAGITAQSGKVIESPHPYEKKRVKWQKEVCLEGAAGLVGCFYSRTCTHNSSTCVRVFSGGLQRDAAGPGARVELAADQGAKVWGTVVERSAGPDGLWKVRLDRQPVAPDKEDEAEDGQQWPQVGDKVEGKYHSGTYYVATVSEIKGDIYVLDWDDGDQRDREKKHAELRKPAGKLAEQLKQHRNLEEVPLYASSAPEREVDCFAFCKETVETLEVRYVGKESVADEQGFGQVVGDDITSFALDKTCPLSPVAVGSLGTGGPAQAKGVAAGWYLDLARTLNGPSKDDLAKILDGLGGVDLSARPVQVAEMIKAAFANLEELVRRFNDKVRALSAATLFFMNSSSKSKPTVLPQATIRYVDGQTVGEEISRLGVTKVQVHVQTFSCKGPAHAAGVRTGWAVDWLRTCTLNSKVDPPLPSKEDFMANPNILLERSGIHLAFRHPHPEKKRVFFGHGSNMWKHFEVLGDNCEFEFESNGDSSGTPETRWGFWAMVFPKKLKDPESNVEKPVTDFTITVERTPDKKLGISFVKGEPTPGEAPEPEKCDGCLGTGTIDFGDGEEDDCPVCEGTGHAKAAPAPEGVCPMLVTVLSKEGLVNTEWNSKNPTLQMAVGDLIVKVNGVEGCDAMEEELKQAKVHTIEVRKQFSHLCPQGHTLMQHKAGNNCSECGTRGVEQKCRSGCGYYVCRACSSTPSSKIEIPIEGDIDSLAARWIDMQQKAQGVKEHPEVLQETWNEQRLRALCARHGWEFEWMTEDGERRRRAREKLTEWRLEEPGAALLRAEALEAAPLPDGAT